MSKKFNPKNQLVLLRAELVNLCDEADSLISASKSESEFEDLIERFINFESDYKEISSAFIDTLEVADVTKTCAEITNDTKTLRGKLRKLKSTKPQSAKSQNSDSSSAKTKTSGKVKLPTLPLPEFEGEVLHFQSFWDQFKCSVHENDEYTPAQKFLYLKSAVKKSKTAISIVNGYEVTDLNYPLAVKRLQFRYGRPRIVIFALVKSILSIEAQGKSTKLLREHHDLLYSRVMSLDNLGMDTKNKIARMLLLPILELKLRSDLLEEWQRETSDMDDNSVDIEYYFKFMDKQILAKESVLRASELHEGSRLVEEFSSDNFTLGSAAALVAPESANSGQEINTMVGPWRNPPHFQSFRPPNPIQSYQPRPNFHTPRMSSNSQQLQYGYGNTPASFKLCPYCRQNHDVTGCQAIQKMTLAERWQWAENSRLCFNCFLPSSMNHRSSNCRKPGCTVEGCGARHHRVLHNQQTHGMIGETNQVGENGHSSNSSESLLQTALAVIVNGSIPMLVRLLFDTGSQRSYIRTGVADSIGLSSSDTENLTITTLGGSSCTRNLTKVKVALRGYYCQTEIIEIKASCIGKICGPLPPCDVNLKLQHLDGLQLSDVFPRGVSMVDILVGIDHYYDFIHGGICRRGRAGKPVALGSELGWIVCGTNQDPTMDYTQSMNAVVSLVSVSNSELHSDLARFWESESLSTADDSKSDQVTSDESTEREFSKAILFDGRRYTVRIPWRPEVWQIESNYQIAFKRLQQIEKQLLYRRPERAKDYCNAIDQYVKDGIAEEVTHDNHIADAVAVSYFSHHAVYREDKSSTKTRIVMNGSLRNVNGKSLNDYIYPGPSLLPDLVGVLLRFRTHKYGITSDIRKMFLQIKLDRRDQDSHRFLWRGLDLSVPPKEYRMTRVTFGINCSPFLAIATVRHHARIQASIFPDATVEVLKNMFVDDLVSGVDSVDTGVERIRQLKTLMSSGSFELTKWASNCRELVESVHDEDRYPNLNATDCKPLGVLGILWNTTDDNLSLAVPDLRDDKFTKRSTAQIVAKVHDPLGFAGPFVVTGKILLQDICRENIDWDQKLTEELKTRSKVWQDQLDSLRYLVLSRTLPAPYCHGKLQLHGFGDASPKAYGAAIYLRAETAPETFQCGLVISKNRVAPLKSISLPRLELLAAELNCVATRFVADNLGKSISDIFFWTDSLVVYSWIRKPPRSPKFVVNHVEKIRKLSVPDQWFYCPGQENPSDLLTRGVRMSRLMEAKNWISGPPWLTDSKINWPVLPDYQAEEKAASDDLRKEAEPIPTSDQTDNPPAHSTLSTVGNSKKTKRQVQPSPLSNITALLDPTRYSTWGKLLRVTVYLKRAVKKFRSYIPRFTSAPLKTTYILWVTSDDLNEAESSWILEIQRIHFSTTIKCLQRKETSANDDLSKLDPCLDAETSLMRVGGRLQHSDLPLTFKHPIILPDHNWVTRLIIEHYHVKASHAGADTVLTLLRNRFWLIHGKREVKRVLHKCRPCRKASERPLTQKMAPLPRERIVPEFAFSSVGIDFAGPVYVRNNLDNPECSAKKAYICLFTCATSRMIHLELCSDLTTSEFLQAFRRMTNRRGLCHTVISDNALTFKSAARILQSNTGTIDSEKVNEYFATQRIRWKFIAERAPWQGGFYERMVQSVKRPLRKLLGKALLTYVELYTVLTDVEAAVNSRPLTAVSTDKRDQEPVTPAHIALGRPLLTLPDAAAASVLEESLSRRFRYRERLVQEYWERRDSDSSRTLAAAASGNVSNGLPRAICAGVTGSWSRLSVLTAVKGRELTAASTSVRTV